MGAGVNLFKSLFPNDYYPYTANTLMSAKPTSKIITGKNQCKGHYDKALAFVSNNYIMSENAGICLIAYLFKGVTYTISGIDINRRVVARFNNNPPAAYESCIEYQSFSGSTFTSDITGLCYIYVYNAVIDTSTAMIEKGSTATAYEPYSQTTITLSGVELRGLLKVADGKLYADGDIDDGSGTGDVGYEERAYQAGDESLANAITDGTTTVVKLATPTTQTLTAWNNPIKACEGGTEEFTDSRSIKMPTGHDTIYSKGTSYRYW